VKIAQVAPLHESVPPQLYGGTERVVSYLTEALVELGHDVTLFATGDSRTSAQLCAVCETGLRLADGMVDRMAPHILLLERVCERASEFDVIHFHIDYLHFNLSRRLGLRGVTTLHGRLDIPELVPLYREFRNIPLVSISDAQRKPLPWVDWRATVYHGLPSDLYGPGDGPGDYLAFVGRISPEKRLDLAIEISKRARVPLRVAAKVDDVDRGYFEAKIEPLLGDSNVEFLGELGDTDKQELLRNALALVFPIDWPEPFGLVMIEAMACGTPVIAFPCGSVREVVDDGVTGFVVNDVEQASRAVAKVRNLDRARCRQQFDRRFTAQRMAEDYLEVYRQLPVAHGDISAIEVACR
jgi:glycosyltransferase involved in cell wall biosynthesis